MLSTSRPGRFTIGEEAPYRSNRTLGESQSQYGRFEEKKKLLSLPRYEHLIVQPEA